MTLRLAAGFSVILSAGAGIGWSRDFNHPHLTGPMPPDPISVNRVAGPLTPASLKVWQMTLDTPDFIWRTLKATETLSTPQLRTLALDLLRIRRFYDEDSLQEGLVLSAWADREPAAVAGELLNLPDWEDRDNAIGDYDSDVEFLAVRFWVNAAQRDFPGALALAAKLEGKETIQQFFGHLANSYFSPEEESEIVRMANRLGLAGFGFEEARKPLRPARRPDVNDPRLNALLSLDAEDRRTPFPFPLYQAVRKLVAAEARQLHARLTESWPESVWLTCLLALQANEGRAESDPVIPVDLSSVSWIGGLNLPKAAVTTKMREFLAQAGAMDYPRVLSELEKLPTDVPLAQQDQSPGFHGLVMSMWALQDFPAAVAYVAQEKYEEKRSSYMGALDAAMNRLPSAEVLAHLPPERLFWDELYLDAWKHFLPFEDREAGFRYFEANLQLLPDEAADFLATAVRFEPARAVALARKQEGALIQTAGGLAMHWPDRIGEFLKQEDGPEVWKAVARSLADYHPEKLLAVLKSQPHRQAWVEGIQRMSHQKKNGQTILLELKANLPPEPAPPPEQNLPDPFKESR